MGPYLNALTDQLLRRFNTTMGAHREVGHDATHVHGVPANIVELGNTRHPAGGHGSTVLERQAPRWTKVHYLTLTTPLRFEETWRRNGERTRVLTREESGWRQRTGPPLGSIGYTGSYREPSPDIVEVSVVSVLEARGPD
jgi:hypothetical protein